MRWTLACKDTDSVFQCLRLVGAGFSVCDETIQRSISRESVKTAWVVNASIMCRTQLW